MEIGTYPDYGNLVGKLTKPLFSWFLPIQTFLFRYLWSKFKNIAMKKVLTLLSTLIFGFQLQAQCPAGELEVFVDVITDDYGYELYWELVPAGNACGVGTIFAGGNTAVGCNGGAVQAQTPGGYANNVTVTEGPFCLPSGQDYHIHFIDDWGDGGIGFEVSVGGFPIYQFQGTGTDEVYTFSVLEPPELDAAMISIETPLYSDLGNIIIEGSIKNLGSSNITAFDLNYSVDGGTTLTETISGVNIAAFEEYDYTHSIPAQIDALGNYNINVWVNNINGMGDDDAPQNDDANKDIIVVEATKNIINSYTLPENTFTQTVHASVSDQLDSPQDLDFHPLGDLWIVNKNSEASGGSTLKISAPSEQTQNILWQRDGNAWHFMSLPTGIAFGRNGMFATSPGVYDANHSGGSPFTGPTLWSSDPAIYAQPSGGNGSHMDMLHESPYSMGIAYEKGNVYWIFDANGNDIVRLRFCGRPRTGQRLPRRCHYTPLPRIGGRLDKPKHPLPYGVTPQRRLAVYCGRRQPTGIAFGHSLPAHPAARPAFAATEPLVEYTNVTGTNLGSGNRPKP